MKERRQWLTSHFLQLGMWNFSQFALLCEQSIVFIGVERANRGKDLGKFGQ